MSNDKRKLKGYVTVDGELFGPTDKIPAKVAERIGDHAWAKADADADAGSGDTAVDEADLAGSTVAALKEYAAQQGFELGEATKKVDVIAAVEAGIAARDTGDTGAGD